MASGEYVSDGELEAVVRGLEDSASQLGEGKGWSDIEDSVWRSYVKAEVLVTKMKLRMGVERPGEFIDPVAREPMTEHIPMALTSVLRARESARLGDYKGALNLLRECRNELRTFLDSARKARLRQARRGVAGRPPSSAPSSKPS